MMLGDILIAMGQLAAMDEDDRPVVLEEISMGSLYRFAELLAEKLEALGYENEHYRNNLK